MTRCTRNELNRLAKCDDRFRLLFHDATHCGVCSFVGMQREVLLKRVCAVSGISDWRVSREPFRITDDDVRPNPYPCEGEPNRLHFLLERETAP